MCRHVHVLFVRIMFKHAKESNCLHLRLQVSSYIPITITITEWRGKLRREMNRTDQVGAAKLHGMGAWPSCPGHTA